MPMFPSLQRALAKLFEPTTELKNVIQQTIMGNMSPFNPFKYHLGIKGNGYLLTGNKMPAAFVHCLKTLYFANH